MHTFTDNAGRTWSVAVNVDAIKRVRDLAKVNLLEALEGMLLQRLADDPVLLCDVLFALCKPEADPRNVSDADFGKAMAGDAIDAGTTALMEELVGFFQKGRRQVLRKALDKLTQFEAKALALVETQLDSPELEASLDNQLRGLARPSGGGNSSGAAPALVESTPAPSPSAS